MSHLMHVNIILILLEAAFGEMNNKQTKKHEY